MNLYVISFITDPHQSIVSKAIVMASSSLEASLILDTTINPNGDQFIQLCRIQPVEESIILVQ